MRFLTSPDGYGRHILSTYTRFVTSSVSMAALTKTNDLKGRMLHGDAADRDHETASWFLVRLNAEIFYMKGCGRVLN